MKLNFNHVSFISWKYRAMKILLKYIALIPFQDAEGHRAVMVLQGWDVIVAQGKLSPGIDLWEVERQGVGNYITRRIMLYCSGTSAAHLVTVQHQYPVQNKYNSTSSSLTQQ